MIKFLVKVRLPSLMNARMHWWAMARLKKVQRNKTRLAMRGIVLPPLPVIVTITRLGPRQLDDDNLTTSCKYVRDEIAARFKIDDGSPLYTWKCEQRVGEYAVEVEIIPRLESPCPH